ncbi:MAG TPA: hypothetical protein VMM12_06830 [Longimicrobiales bacterium]|nr:hypothetical protein [Longimicrobiales bacterium]
MRRSTLLLVVVLAACGEADRDVYTVVDDFLDRALPARCARAWAGAGIAVSELRSASDSTWLLLDEPRRRIAELDERMRTLWSLEYAAVGPGSAGKAVSAALLGDTAVAIADRGSLRLLVLSRGGELIRSTPLGFLPNMLAATPGGEVLVTPLRFGDEPPTLLVRFADGRRTELAVPPRYHPDVLVRTMGNIARVEVLPDGRALVLHEYMAPRGFAVDLAGGVTRLAVPTPDATLEQLRYIPTPPLTEADQPRILVPALGLSVDRSRSEVYLMTRSGRTVAGVAQRAILRLDDRLGFLEGYTIDVAASRMAVLPRHRVAVVADDEDHLYTCALPAEEPHARTG